MSHDRIIFDFMGGFKKLVFPWLLLCCLGAFAQDATTAQKAALHFTIDNDAFLFSQTDQYYSSGLYAKYFQAVDPNQYLFNYLQKNAQVKVSKFWGLNHQIYTPIKFNSARLSDYDRPHAALLFASYGFQLISPSIIISHRLDLGWMGPALGTGPMLKFWHNIFGYREPRGWDYEINNSPVAQIGLSLVKPLIDQRHFNINWKTEGQLGTIYNHGMTGFDLRTGLLRPINTSMIYNMAYLDESGDSKKIKEWYAILSTDIEWVGYNATIEGNLIGASPPHTEKAEPWVWHYGFGVGMAWAQFDVQISLNYRSAEVISADKHKFVQFKLNYAL